MYLKVLKSNGLFCMDVFDKDIAIVPKTLKYLLFELNICVYKIRYKNKFKCCLCFNSSHICSTAEP